MYRKQIRERAIQLDKDGYPVTKINDILHKQFPNDLQKKSLSDRTIYMWLKQASVVTEEQKYTTEDIALAKSRHCNDIATIAKLLAQLLFNVRENADPSPDGSDLYRITYFDQNGEQVSTYYSREDLGDRLVFQMILLADREEFSDTQIRLLLSHLYAEYAIPRSKNWRDIIKEDPYGFLEKLELMRYKAILSGTCEECESWYKE